MNRGVFAQTLANHLVTICRQTLTSQTGGRELRIFLSSFPPDVVWESMRETAEFLSSGTHQVQYVFRVGTALWSEWNASPTDPERAALTCIADNGWVDLENRMTHYRNMKCARDFEHLVVVLIGIEKATDRASLQDFYIVDTARLWHDELKGTFQGWIKGLLNAHHISWNKEDIKEMDDLLKTLYRYGTGDLVQASKFLEGIAFNGAQDSRDALALLHEGLPFWGLPPLRDIPFKRKGSSYLKDAVGFFSYRDYLKESERAKALRKIDLFEENFQAGRIDGLPDPFTDLDDFVACMRNYVLKNDVDARTRLIKVDFAFIRDKVLGIKSPPSKGDKLKPQKIDAPPLEAVLTAVWRTLSDFKARCFTKGIQSGKALNEIRLRAECFRHDFENNEDARGLIIGCLGGIDSLILDHLRIETVVEGETKHIEVSSFLCQVEEIDDLKLERHKSSTPGFQFIVEFVADDELEMVRLFQWQLPETQPYRTLWNFAEAVHTEMQKNPGYCLPVFTVPYFDELFLAPDEEETNRILNLSLNGLKVRNLLKAPGIADGDPMIPVLKDLATAFGEFLEAVVDRGWFTALDKVWGDTFFKKTRAAFSRLLSYDGTEELSPVAPLLYKAFMLLREQPDEMFSHTVWVPHVEAAAITGLHPCLIEMLHHREAFLFHGLATRMQEALNDLSGLKLRESMWQDICDMATVKYPLFGIVRNSNRDLETDVASLGLIHRFGKAGPKGQTLSVKMLLRYDAPDDEEMSDSDLFRQSRESQVVTRVLTEYTDLYPHVCDGLSLCVLNVKDLQTVIAGIDTFLKQRAKLKDAEVEEPGPPYHFSLTIFVGVNETQGISRWLQEWRRRWSVAQDNGKSAYTGCKLSISQRVVKDRNDYIHLLAREAFEVDVALLPHFIDAGSAGNDVCAAMPYYSCWDYLLKFPIVEVPHCAEAHPAMACERSRIVSNRQFELPTLHAELSARFKHPGNPASHKYLVIRRGDYTPWMPIVDELHKRATWVVCLDSSIDEQLIRQNASSNAWKREIIGFSSGLGAHGELNYTISTERSSLVDVERAIRDQVNGLFGPWRHEEIAKASHRLVQESRRLSGLSLVRATGPSQYVRDLIAYTLVRISLPELPARGVLLCDELLALDTFRHWFDTAESGERPDLLRLVVFLRDNGRIEVAAQLIECKLAKQAEAHLQKAHEQLENGLRHLSMIFHPRCGKSGRFDQRFWWAQLQRLIASKSVVSPGISKQAVTATLETLGEGRFDISWQAAVVAFWTDSTSDRFTVEKKWEFENDIGNLGIEVISGGTGLVHKVCCLGETVCLPLPETMIFLKSEDGEKVGDVSSTSSPGEEAAEETIEARSGTSYSPEEVDIEAPAEIETVEMEEMEVQEPLATSIAPSVFSEDPRIPGRILLGRSLKGSREVFWEFGHPELSNRHILLFGRSGSGKTYAIQALLCELGMKGQNSVIVDYTDGFEKAQLEQETLNILNPKQHFIYSQPLPINPFRRQLSSIGDEILPEKPNNTAQRVMSVFASVYSLGDQQKSLLYECIKDGIEVHGAEMNLERLIDLFHAYVSDGGRKETAISLLSKIKPFVDGDPFGKEDRESWLRFYDDRESRAHIIQLKGCGREFGCLVTEFALIDLYWFARASGDVRHPKVVVLDEIQNLDHSQESPIAKFLTEGRKFGLSMILATQTLRNLREDARHRLFQASHKLFFRPAETEVQEYAKILEATVGESAELWRRRLTGLGKGECFSLGPSMNHQTGRLEDKAFAIKISALNERVRG